MKKLYVTIFLVSFGAMGIAVGYTMGIFHEKGMLAATLQTLHPIRENNTSYKFIKPLLAYIIPSADHESDFAALKTSLAGVIGSEKAKGRVSDVSMFLSDLDRGRWIGINEDVPHPPASMLKVVIMVAYFKEKEQDANLFNKKLEYTQELDGLLEEYIFNATSALHVGEYYEVEDLIHRMIIESDNGAEFLLLNHIDNDQLSAVYEALGIENPGDGEGTFAISPRNYSLFFRILYSATYLRKSNSEQALEILSKTTFNEGIVAGVPEGVPVAHKFGEHVSSRNGVAESLELHDCGIVYHAQNPYLLCVMTKGKELGALKEMIKTISGLVYNHRAR